MAPRPVPTPQAGIRAQPQAAPQPVPIPTLQPIRQGTVDYMMTAEGTQAAQTGTGSFVEGTFRPYQQGTERWRNGAIKYTIGYGHVIPREATDRTHPEYNQAVRDAWFDNGLTPAQAQATLRADFRARRESQRVHHNATHGAGFFERLSQDKQDLLADTYFQAGNTGRMPRMAAELARGNTERALVESWFRAQGPQAEGIRNRTVARRNQFFPELAGDYTEFNQQYPLRNMGVSWNTWNKVPSTSPGGMEWNAQHGVPGTPEGQVYDSGGEWRDPAWDADPVAAQRIQNWDRPDD